MSDVRNELIRRIKERRPELCGSAIKFPAYISFDSVDGRLSKLVMHIHRDKAEGGNPCVAKNMQTDAAAFEGWALALKAVFPELLVQLDWDAPPEANNKHYQRFLYRVHKFKEAFFGWFCVARNYEQDLRIKRGGNYVLNVPTKQRDGKSNKQDASTGGSERAVEKQFMRNAQTLLLAAGMEKGQLGNQLPIGLFEGRVSKLPGHAVFTGGASAVDLWAVSEDNTVLSIFELKGSENRKVGVISELFFYAMVIRDIACGEFRFDQKKYDGVVPWPPDYITRKIRRINAYVLAQGLHPLYEDELVFELLNSSFSMSDHLPVSFGYLKYSDNLEITKVTLNGCDCRH